MEQQGEGQENIGISNNSYSPMMTATLTILLATPPSPQINVKSTVSWFTFLVIAAALTPDSCWCCAHLANIRSPTVQRPQWPCFTLCQWHVDFIFYLLAKKNSEPADAFFYPLGVFSHADVGLDFGSPDRKQLQSLPQRHDFVFELPYFSDYKSQLFS